MTIASGGTAGDVGFLVFRATPSGWQVALARDGYKVGLFRVGGDLVSSQPIYKANDPNCCPTGGFATTATTGAAAGSCCCAAAHEGLQALGFTAVRGGEYPRPRDPGRPRCCDDRELYRQMLLIRRTEEKLLQLHSQGLSRGRPTPRSARSRSPSASARQLDARDSVFSTHRCHGHFLAAGGDLAAFLAELMGREGGVSGGRGGSQHLHAPGFI